MNKDFAEFFASLNSGGVEYLVIGGVACNFHAPPRATEDIDLWVGPERGNLQRLLQTIEAFGFPTDGVDLDDLSTRSRVLMLGHVPNRVDILTRPPGVEWGPAWSRRISGHYGDVPVSYVSSTDLITTKRAAGRPRDLADAAMREEIERRGKLA